MALLLILPMFMFWIQSPASVLTWALLTLAAVGVTLGATAAALPLVQRVAVAGSAG